MDYSQIYDPDQDFDVWYSIATGAVIGRLIRHGDSILELGCATGVMTAQFAAAGATIVAVDRSSSYLKVAGERLLEGVRFVEADLDEYEPSARFDHVVLANVLHEVRDPVGVLRMAARALSDAGLLHLSLQNPQSLHRQVAIHMGLIGGLRAISDRGHAYGTRAIWSADEVLSLVRRADLECLYRRGVMLKPLTNEQMRLLPREVLEGYAAVGADLPDFCAMNLFLCTRLGSAGRGVGVPGTTS